MIPSPSWPEVVRLYVDARLAGLHCHMPGKVLSYDANTQRATIRPMLTFAVPSAIEEDLDVLQRLPDLLDVPVLQDQGGGFFAHMPVSAGDGVLVEFMDRDPSGFEQSGDISDTLDRSVHSLGYPVAVLGYGARASAIPAPGAGLVLGSKAGLRTRHTATTFEVDGSSDAAAKAGDLDAFFDLLGAIPAAGDPAGAVTAVNALIAAFAAVASVASAKLKIGG